MRLRVWLAAAWLVLVASGVRAHNPNVTYTVMSPLLAPGESFSYDFTEAGTYTFHCHPHPWMTGSLTVTSDAAAPSHVDFRIEDSGNETAAGLMRFSNVADAQPVATLHTGGTVTWTNDGTLHHDVMAGKLPPAKASSPAPMVPALLAAVLTVAALARRTRR